MTLQPIRSIVQIEDSIKGIPAAAIIALREKVQAVERNVASITHVNGRAVFNVQMDKTDIRFSFRPHTKPSYYYPIQYAKIEIGD